MFNNHINHFMPMPNFSMPPPSRHPPPLSSTRVFFPPISQPQQLLYPRPFAQPHMNPQFFNLSVPPPPIPKLITNLIASNLHTYPNQTRPQINVAHQITTSDRFTKLRHVGREESGFVHGVNR
uniref:Uncharacterized protein n=1 Tax=Globodera rostochiensis TaxID=31243 RepID=A0A914H006_GLORO